MILIKMHQLCKKFEQFISIMESCLYLNLRLLQDCQNHGKHQVKFVLRPSIGELKKLDTVCHQTGFGDKAIIVVFTP